MHNTNGTLNQGILPTIAGGYTEVDPSSNNAKRVVLPTSGTFKITMKDLDSDESASVDGEMPYNVISQDNLQNPHAERLAGANLSSAFKEFQHGLFVQSQYSTVLWPSPAAVSNKMKAVPITADGVYSIGVQVNGKEPVTQTFRFLLDKGPLSMSPVEQKQLRQSKLGRFSRYMIKAHANAANSSVQLDRAGMYMVQLPNGDTVHMTLEETSPGQYAIVNMEVLSGYSHYRGGSGTLPRYNRTPATTPSAYNGGSGGVKEPFTFKVECDSTHIDHVSGLYMALKDRVADYEDVVDVLKSANTNPTCEVIRSLQQKQKEYQKQLTQLEKYHEKLHAEGPNAATKDPKMSYLIAQVIEDQYEYEHVGAKFKQNAYSAKILQGGTDAASRLKSELVNRYEEAQNSVRQADQDIADSKARAKGKGAGTKIKETAKRAGYNIKKGKAILVKKKAAANIRDLKEAIDSATGLLQENEDPQATIATFEELKRDLTYVMRVVTGGYAPREEEEADAAAERETDSSYMGNRRGWSY